MCSILALTLPVPTGTNITLAGARKKPPVSRRGAECLVTNISTPTTILTLPSPLPHLAPGALIPAFKMGAGFGRLVGEAMHVWFPDGFRYGSQVS